jgi:spore coat protein U-like protein
VRSWRRPEAALVFALALAGGAAAQRPPAQIATPLPANGCDFIVVDAVNFGNYDDASSRPTLTTATFQLKCSGVGNQDVVLAAGPSAATGDLLDRRLRGPGGSELRYQLYTNPARTVVWGDGTRGTSVIVVNQHGSFRDVTVYGGIPADQGGDVGAYGDFITVTVFP